MLALMRGLLQGIAATSSPDLIDRILIARLSLDVEAMSQS